MYDCIMYSAPNGFIGVVVKLKPCYYNMRTLGCVWIDAEILVLLNARQLKLQVCSMNTSRVLLFLQFVYRRLVKLSETMWVANKPISQIPQCTCPISHSAPFRTEVGTFLFRMVHFGMWISCIVVFVNFDLMWSPWLLLWLCHCDVIQWDKQSHVICCWYLSTFNLCIPLTWPLTCVFHIYFTHTPKFNEMCDK